MFMINSVSDSFDKVSLFYQSKQLKLIYNFNLDGNKELVIEYLLNGHIDEDVLR